MLFFRDRDRRDAHDVHVRLERELKDPCVTHQARVLQEHVAWGRLSDPRCSSYSYPCRRLIACQEEME